MKPRIEQMVEEVAQEAHRRREMLIAAFMVEARVPASRVELVVRNRPGLTAWWVDVRSRRRTVREWARDLRMWLRDPRRRRLSALAKEFFELGLVARDTALFAELQPQGVGTVRVYWAKRETLQVTCQLCRVRVALADWDRHVAKKHGNVAQG